MNLDRSHILNEYTDHKYTELKALRNNFIKQYHPDILPGSIADSDIILSADETNTLYTNANRMLSFINAWLSAGKHHKTLTAIPAEFITGTLELQKITTNNNLSQITSSSILPSQHTPESLLQVLQDFYLNDILPQDAPSHKESQVSDDITITEDSDIFKDYFKALQNYFIADNIELYIDNYFSYQKAGMTHTRAAQGLMQIKEALMQSPHLYHWRTRLVVHFQSNDNFNPKDRVFITPQSLNITITSSMTTNELMEALV